MNIGKTKTADLKIDDLCLVPLTRLELVRCFHRGIFFTTHSYLCHHADTICTDVVVRTMSSPCRTLQVRFRRLPYSLYTFCVKQLGSALPTQNGSCDRWGFAEFDNIHTGVSHLCALPIKVPCVCRFRHSGKYLNYYT